MRIDQAGGDRPAVGVEPGEPAHRIAVGLDGSLDRGARPDGGDPTVPAGHDRRVRGIRSPGVVGGQSGYLGLALAGAKPAGQGHDLGGTHDEQPRGRLVAAATLDDPERAAAHRPEPFGWAARAASSRSSRTCIGEKSRSFR